MPQLTSLETKGLACEIIGLLMLVVAATWQAAVTDWLDTFPARSQYFIQETANLAILQALGKTAEAIREDDPSRRKNYLDQADTISRKAMFDLVNLRTSVERVERNQGSPLKTVRHILFIVGALLVVVGKLLVMLHKNVQARAG